MHENVTIYKLVQVKENYAQLSTYLREEITSFGSKFTICLVFSFLRENNLITFTFYIAVRWFLFFQFAVFLYTHYHNL